MTSPSPTLTSSPSPTATTFAVWGFSLAVSGSTIPEGVVSSRSTIWTSARSPRGLNFISLPPLILDFPQLSNTPRDTRRDGVSPRIARDCKPVGYLVQLQSELLRELVLGQGRSEERRCRERV